jgi:hypothetical protein
MLSHWHSGRSRATVPDGEGGDCHSDAVTVVAGEPVCPQREPRQD